MKLSEELVWRGFVNQTTLEDITELDDNPIKFYFGVDPSADSMQIGNLAAAMMVRCFASHGHEAYLLVGGATGMIGDPDGKASERTLLTVEQIETNKAAIASQYKTVFQDKPFTLVDNYSWFQDMNYLAFLRDVGKHVPMSQMLGRDFIQARLGEGGSGISYAEFSYALIQGYDFFHLNKEYGVTLQLCGADQWGNSITGVDLIRRMSDTRAHVYSMPLIINKATGVKFGKSENGAVWLDEKKTSVYKFYQFWLNVDDEGVIDYMKAYTLLDKNEVDQLSSDHKRNPGDRIAQKRLAEEVTTLVHGVDRCEAAVRVTDVLFGGADFSTLSEEDISLLSKEIPTAKVGKGVVDTLVESGVASSRGEATRLIQGGAISVSGQKIDSDRVLAAASLIKKGKNSFVLVQR